MEPKKVKCANCPATFDRGSQLTRHSASCRPAKPASTASDRSSANRPENQPQLPKNGPALPRTRKKASVISTQVRKMFTTALQLHKPNSSTAMLHNQARDKLEVPQSQDEWDEHNFESHTPPHPKALGIEVQRKLNHPASNARKPYVTPITAAPLMVISRATNKEVTSIRYEPYCRRVRAAAPSSGARTTSPDLVVGSHAAEGPSISQEPCCERVRDASPSSGPASEKEENDLDGKHRLALRPQWRSTQNAPFDSTETAPLPAPQRSTPVQKKARTDSSAKAPIPPQPQTAFEQAPAPFRPTPGRVLVPSTSQIEPEDGAPPQSPSMYYMEGGLMRSVFLQRYSLAYNTQHNLFICTSCQSALTSSNLLVHLKDTEKFTISREAGDKLSAGCPNCMYTADKKQVLTHLKGCNPSLGPSDILPKVPSQRFHQGSQSQPPNHPPKVSAPLRSPFDAILKEFTDFAPQAPPTVEIPADKRLINPWILQTGFHLYVQGHNVAELRAAAKLPTTEETHLKDLSKRVVELIMDSNSLIDGTSHPLRRRIYTVDPAQLERTPLKSHQEQSTNSNYGNLIAHLVAAIVRGGTSTLRFPTTPAIQRAVSELKRSLTIDAIHSLLVALFLHSWETTPILSQIPPCSSKNLDAPRGPPPWCQGRVIGMLCQDRSSIQFEPSSAHSPAITPACCYLWGYLLWLEQLPVRGHLRHQLARLHLDILNQSGHAQINRAAETGFGPLRSLNYWRMLGQEPAACGGGPIAKH
ncbi:hypothetical protein DFP72DRAFT_862134 [Ephemerocybe angulata]|uniref:C2H2-type domain-containing protein n=1 Tax=Ephemerocybe angulata TaxID=980116 RepID=A0A8H6H937_9AGAR|nr:hypothetical protein DFP72DRAFT_862134 [Tulosesus angulatus]